MKLLSFVMFTLFLISCNNEKGNNLLNPFILNKYERVKIDSLISQTPFSIEAISFNEYQKSVWVNNKAENQKFIVVKYKNNNAEVLQKKSFVKLFCNNLGKILGSRLKDSLNYKGLITEIEINKNGFIRTQKGIMTVGYEFEK
jgi:hypothetical protein